MATTNTPNHGLGKPADGDQNWGAVYRAAMDALDARLPRSYAGNPNGNVAGVYVGQPIFDSNNVRQYYCTTIGDEATAVWQIAGGVPMSCVMMHAGTVATIPAGWQLCDGTNGTVDLRDKFIVGAREDETDIAKTNVTGSLTQTGGAASGTTSAAGGHDHGGNAGDTTLTTAQIPEHDHDEGSLVTNTTGAHTHDVPSNGGATGTGLQTTSPGAGTTSTLSAGAHSHTITGSVGSTGGGEAHTHSITAEADHTHDVDTLPPYYALCFIQQV